MSKWRDLAYRFDNPIKSVTIALVGKYTKLEDAYASVVKSLQHSTLACNHKLKLKYVEAADLEPLTRDKNPAKYHEAWREVCRSE